MTDREANERVLSGDTWAEFCDALKQAGELVNAPRAPRTPATGRRAIAT